MTIGLCFHEFMFCVHIGCGSSFAFSELLYLALVRK